MAGLCYWADMRRSDQLKERILNTGWLFIALAFILLSMDEMGSFHESIGGSELFKKMGTANRTGWYAFYCMGGLVALFMGIFFLVRFQHNKWVLLFAIAGFLLFVSNPFQEKYEHYMWDNSPDPSRWHRPVFFLLLEEGSELLASLCFLCSFTGYAIGAILRNNIGLPDKRLTLELKPKRNFIFYLLTVFVLMGVSMLLIYLNAWHLKEDDRGRPQNWFPAILAFTTFIISMYQFFKSSNPRTPGFGVYLYIALSGLFASVYFAADIYNYENGYFSRLPYVLLAVSGFTAIAAMIKLSGPGAKIATFCWLVFIVLSVFTKEFFNPPLYGFIAFSFLLMALFFHFKDRSKV